MIRLWNTRFEEIGAISVREVLAAEGAHFDLGRSSFSAQSLDVYHCYSAEDEEKVDTILLFGTRDGSVFETKIFNKFQGLQTISNAQTKDIGTEKITLKQKCLHNGIPSGGTCNFDIGKKYMATYSTTSLRVAFWDIDKREFVKSIELSTCPSVVSFSPTNCLAVGASCGSIEFYELGEPLSIARREDRLFYSHEHCPWAIKFSSDEKKVAVCYKRTSA